MDSALRWPWRFILGGFVLGVVVDVAVRAYSGVDNAGDAGLPLFLATTAAAVLLGLVAKRADDVRSATLAGAVTIALGQFLAWLATAEETTFVFLGVITVPATAVYCWGVSWGSVKGHTPHSGSKGRSG